LNTFITAINCRRHATSCQQSSRITGAFAAVNIEQVHKVQSARDNDMAVLRANQSAHTAVVKLDYTWDFYRTPAGTWQTVKQNGALSLMPHPELQKYVYVYEVFTGFMYALVASNVQMEVAGAIARCAPDGNLSARDIEELITATSEAQGKLAFVARLREFEELGLKHVHQ